MSLITKDGLPIWHINMKVFNCGEAAQNLNIRVTRKNTLVGSKEMAKYLGQLLVATWWTFHTELVIGVDRRRVAIHTLSTKLTSSLHLIAHLI